MRIHSGRIVVCPLFFADKDAKKLPLDVPSISGGVDVLDYKSSVEFNCKLLGYGVSQGCKP